MCMWASFKRGVIAEGRQTQGSVDLDQGPLVAMDISAHYGDRCDLTAVLVRVISTRLGIELPKSVLRTEDRQYLFNIRVR